MINKKKYGAVAFQCFTLEQVKEINKEIKKNITKKENPSKAAQNVSKIGEFCHVPCMSLMELIHPWLYQCQIVNRNYFGYDIYWDFHLDTLNYNEYGVGGEYGWHIDSNSEKEYDIKLTCLLNLSEEPYEGGELCKINEMDVYTGKSEFASGMGLIFNSLIAHKVTPVTKGERITLSYWAYGPPWR